MIYLKLSQIAVLTIFNFSTSVCFLFIHRQERACHCWALKVHQHAIYQINFTLYIPFNLAQNCITLIKPLAKIMFKSLLCIKLELLDDKKYFVNYSSMQLSRLKMSTEPTYLKGIDFPNLQDLSPILKT